MKEFKPEHMNACKEDFLGNNGIGRYILMPGSDGRAKQIAEKFENVKVKEHSRRHNLYIGELKTPNGKIDVASISSGMGTPSLDIIVNELIRLGAKRFLRVGTAGLLQPHFMKAGDFVIASGAIKDDGATQNYICPEFPAIGSFNYIRAAVIAAERLNYSQKTHVGVVHSKGSLYAREFKTGPMAAKNAEYMKLITDSGAIASEMEAAMLFVLTQIYNQQLSIQKKKKLENHEKICSGAVCVVLGEGDDFGSAEHLARITNEVVDLSIQTIIELKGLEKIC